MNFDAEPDAKPSYRPPIRSFTQRGSRLGRKYEGLLEGEGSAYLVEAERGAEPSSLAPSARLDLASVFEREAPLAIEIGPGSGEQCVAWAASHPDWNVLAIEAWHPGAARCVARIIREGAANVRVLEADAATALPVIFGLERTGEGTIHPNATNTRAHEIWTFFPDPWRKKKHFKRRLVNPAFAEVVAQCLAPGGSWRLATDWDSYAWPMRDAVESVPALENPYRGERPDPADTEPERGGFAPRWDGRVLTRFEQRGIEAGRRVHDLHVIKRESS